MVNKNGVQLDQATFETLAENSLDAILITDMQVKFIYANPSAYKLFGCDPEKDEIIGTSGTRFWLEKDIPFLQQVVLPQAMAGGWIGEVKNQRADGTIIDVQASAFVIRDAQNQPVSLAVSIRDITARKQTEAALIDERNFANVVLDSLPGIFYVYDMQGHFIRWNKNCAVVAERSDAEMSNTLVMEVIAEESRELVGQRVQQTFIEGQANVEAILVGLNGKRTPYYLTGRRLTLGNKVYLAGIGLDLSERQKIEAETRQLQEQIIEAQRHALQELSTPIIPVLDRIIVMPLIGSIDSLRAKDITRTLLAGISQYRAKIVIVDITGVPLVDSGVADHLNKTIQAARLKGAQTIITGMSDAVAEAIIDLGIDWSGIQTLSDLQTGLMVAISTLGLKLSR